MPYYRFRYYLIGDSFMNNIYLLYTGNKRKQAKEETSDWGLEIAGKLEQTSRPQELRDLFPSG